MAVRVALTGCCFVSGCGQFKPAPVTHYVYVTARQQNLRDRVAAVSNRTGLVANGEKLKVLDHARHWVKVQTPQNEIGWIEEKAVVTEEQADAFSKLKDDHQKDPAVASGVVRDQVYMHIAPGRDAEHLYLLEEGAKLQLLRRATLEKVTAAPGVARAQRAIPQAEGTNAAKKSTGSSPAATVDAAIAKGKAGTAPAEPPPVMEDWWLARDAAGHTGWLFARMVDVDAPDALTRYAEGQKFVGAYVLTTVHDDDAPGAAKDVPVYLAVMNSYKAGLPYDFDQVRVFTWSIRNHRYETGFREKNIAGYLPVQVTKLKDPGGKSATAQTELPAFTYRVLSAEAGPVVPDPVTGEIKPGKTIAKTYRLEGNTLKRISSGVGTLTTELEAHPAAEEKKDKKGKKR